MELLFAEKAILKGFEYEVVPSFDSKHMIALQSDSDENYIGEIIEYE